METLTVRHLDPAEHIGRKVRITTRHEIVREGVLGWGGTAIERKEHRSHWYLYIPCSHPAFPEAALSLEWSADAPVEFLD